MKITALLENTVKDPALKAKHGLSFYIETTKHKVLFDLGPDDSYIHNAQMMGIDLTQVDTVIISHGHYDHGGALASFFSINDRAKVFLRPQAFGPYYYKRLFKKKYIGLDVELVVNDRIFYTDDTLPIDEELFIFSDVQGQHSGKSGHCLHKKTANGYKRDDFLHEQNLIVTAEGKSVLFSGCSHRGIDNILKAAENHQSGIQAVFGGFHLFNPTTKAVESPKLIGELANELAESDIVYYTGHCTGNDAFEILKGIMGEKIQYFATGSVVEF